MMSYGNEWVVIVPILFLMVAGIGCAFAFMGRKNKK